MRVLCGSCRNSFARAEVERVGRRLLCTRCQTPPPPLKPLDLSGYERVGRVLCVVGLVAKGLVYVLFFGWAATSATGHAALRGVVLGDMFGFVMFGLLNLHYGRFRLTAGALFEIALLVVFLGRSGIAIPNQPDALAITAGFFFAFLLGKTAIWGAEHALPVTGVKEPG